MRDLVQRSVVAGACLVAAAGLGACGGGDTSSSSRTAVPAVPQATSGANIAPADDALSGDLIGSGCASYNASHPTGASSLEGMAQEPVVTAAANNPMLSTLSSALSGKLNSGVNLADTLNSGQFTVFAPVNTAFAKVAPATMGKLKTDKVALSNLLTYHVIAGQMSPSRVGGTQSTVEGGTLKVTGSGNDMRVNGARVVCGGLKTSNATVYLIDNVLTPPAKK